MAQENPDPPAGDPWMAFGYLVSGVVLYGLIGWLLDRWWNTSFLVVVGILTGAALGMYQTWARFKPAPDQPKRPAAPEPEQT